MFWCRVSSSRACSSSRCTCCTLCCWTWRAGPSCTILEPAGRHIWYHCCWWLQPRSVPLNVVSWIFIWANLSRWPGLVRQLGMKLSIQLTVLVHHCTKHTTDSHFPHIPVTCGLAWEIAAKVSQFCMKRCHGQNEDPCDSIFLAQQYEIMPIHHTQQTCRWPPPIPRYEEFTFFSDDQDLFLTWRHGSGPGALALFWSSRRWRVVGKSASPCGVYTCRTTVHTNFQQTALLYTKGLNLLTIPCTIVI